MRLLVLGAAGGLGRNAIDAALEAGHHVSAFMRGPRRDAPLRGSQLLTGDAGSPEDVRRAMAGHDIALFCVNPPFSEWAQRFPTLLRTSIEAARTTGIRLVFPANVWIYGNGDPSMLVDETRVPDPISKHGRVRASMERELIESGIRWTMVRLPEFYGPHVVTLAARIFRAAIHHRRVLWPGPLHVDMEMAYMPDAARGFVRVACASDVDQQCFHLPGIRTTPAAFIRRVFDAAGLPMRATGLPSWVLSIAGLFDATARSARDIMHLWTHPVFLDGTRYRQRFGDMPQTDLDRAIATTLAWHRENRQVSLQA